MRKSLSKRYDSEGFIFIRTDFTLEPKVLNLFLTCLLTTNNGNILKRKSCLNKTARSLQKVFSFLKKVWSSCYRVFRKKLCFFHNSLQPLPRLHCCKRPSKLAMRVYSHSYCLVIFCTTNSSRVLARDRWQTFANSWKKTQYLMNTLYLTIILSNATVWPDFVVSLWNLCQKKIRNMYS